MSQEISNQLLKEMIKNISDDVTSIKQDVATIKASMVDNKITLALHDKRIADLERENKESETDKDKEEEKINTKKIAWMGFAFMIIQAVVQYFLTKL